jgi:competence protein ComEA
LRSWRDSAITVGFGVVLGLLGAGILLLVSSPPRGKPIQLLPPPSPAPLAVYVAGAVVQPGVYSLPRGSRAQDALLAAGGFSPDANQNAVNLAAPVADGERLYVPVRSATGAVELTASSQGRLVNLNTASADELEALPGIGPALAARIIAYREENGPFPVIDDLIKVAGIGPVKFNGLKHLVSVEDTPDP